MTLRSPPPTLSDLRTGILTGCLFGVSALLVIAGIVFLFGLLATTKGWWLR